MLYDDQKFAEIYHSLQTRGKKLAWLFGYPDQWDKPSGLDKTFQIFVGDLCRANIVTWNRQYNDDKRPLRIPDLSGWCPLSPCELYKSLRGLRYNLSDNDGIQTDVCKCLKLLGGLIDSIASEIIEELPAYQQATTW